MRQQDWRDLSLKRVVEMIEEGKFAIPMFQRKHVWDAEANINLAYSIYRGRPINALTLIPRKGALELGARSLELKGIPLSDQFEYQVLDGQQRLTGIASVFCHHQGSKKYFFDLLAVLQQQFPKDLIRFKDENLNNKYEITEEICICVDTKKAITLIDNPRFVLGRDLIEGMGMTHIVRFMSTLALENDSPEYAAYMKVLAQLHSIGDYIIYANIINENTPEKEAIEIFLRMNRGGVTLKIWDLINAHSFQYKQIPDGLKHVLAKGISQAMKENPNIRPLMRSMGYKNDKEFNMMSFLNILYLYHIFVTGGSSFRIRSYFDLYAFGSLKFFELWESPQRANLFKALDFFAKNQWHKFLSVAQMERFSAFVMAEPEILNDRILCNRLKYALIHQFFQTKDNLSLSNSRLMTFCRDLQKILHSAKNAMRKYEDLPQVSHPVSISKETILQTTKGTSRLYRLVIHLMNEEKGGFFTQDLSGLSLNSESNPDQHHIFPHSLHKHIPISNSIANITLLDKSVNQKQVSNIPFDSYMKTLQQRLGDKKFEDMCRLNMIDYPAYLADQENGMTEDQAVSHAIMRRAEKMTDFVNHYFMHG